jgi:hypothetical protein
MSDDKNSGIDPRFDPAFQRGFDQAIPIEESVPAPAPRKLSAPPSTPKVAAPPVASAFAPPAAPADVPAPKRAPAVVPAAALPVAIEDLDPAAADEPQLESMTDVPPSRNPFLLFLGIIAIALIATGIWLFVRSGDAFNSTVVRSQGDYMSLYSTINMAPFIALLGAATAIAVLFVFAVKYRGRRPR